MLYSAIARTSKERRNVTRLGTKAELLSPNLKPEMQTSIEVGTDLGFFDNRLRLEATYYESENENQIFNVGAAPSSGSTSVLINAGLNDPRVMYWRPSKMTSKLRQYKTDDNLLLLKTNMGTGHYGKSGRYDFLKDLALIYVFMLDLIGKSS